MRTSERPGLWVMLNPGPEGEMLEMEDCCGRRLVSGKTYIYIYM